MFTTRWVFIVCFLIATAFFMFKMQCAIDDLQVMQKAHQDSILVLQKHRNDPDLLDKKLDDFVEKQWVYILKQGDTSAMLSKFIVFFFLCCILCLVYQNDLASPKV